MKKLALLFLLSISFIGNAQSSVNKDQHKNFKIQKNEVVWQYTFESEMKIDSLKMTYFKNIMSAINSQNLNELENRISFYIEDETINYKEYYDGNFNNKPGVLSYPMSCFVMIDFKDYKYRVTVKNISLDCRPSILGIVTMENYLTKKNVSEFRTSKISHSYSEVLDKYFLDEYTLKNVISENDNW